MKAAFLFLLALAAAGATEPTSPGYNPQSLLEVPAAPERGFIFHAYYSSQNQPKVKRRHSSSSSPTTRDALVTTWRSIAPPPISLARDSSVGNFVAKKLGIPLLVPVFPRPSSVDSMYTHSLDRDTILIPEGPLKRLDLQLLAMITDARERLAADGPSREPKDFAERLFRVRIVHEPIHIPASGTLGCRRYIDDKKA